MGWILRLLLVLLVIRMLVRFFASILQGMQGPATKSAGTRALPLVKDPVCGTFVVPSRALTIGHGELAQYFCSETCLAKYRSR